MYSCSRLEKKYQTVFSRLEKKYQTVAMQYEDILKHVGAFGTYQKLMIFAFVMIELPLACQFIGQVFWAPGVDHWCRVQDSLAINCSQLDSVAECQEEQKAGYIPYEVNEDGSRIYSSCERFVAEVGSGQGLNGSDTIPCDAGWDFDRSRYKSTITEDFSLVCDRGDFASIAQSVWFAGVLAGSLVWGSVGDWIGRRITFIVCMTVTSISSIVTSFVQSYEAYTILRFVTAATIYGAYLMTFVVATEIVGPKQRAKVGAIFNIFFGVGYIFLSGMAFLLREWRHLQLATSVPFLLWWLLFIVFPESPRWLISKNKPKEATQVLKKISKVNRANVPDNIFDALRVGDAVEKSRPSSRVTHLDLVRGPNLRKITIIMAVNWFVVNMAYYGLSLSTSNFGIDDYLSAFVSAALEIPSVLLGWFLMERFGRRLTLSFFYVSGGLSILITIFLPLGAARATVAMVGKFAITAVFNHVYVYAGELYPTVIRSMGLGVCSTVARISGILCPIILILDKYWEPLPLVIFGGSSLIAGIVTLLLPETLGRNLPDTIAEGEKLGESHGLRLCHRAEPTEDDANANSAPTKNEPLSTDDKTAAETNAVNISV